MTEATTAGPDLDHLSSLYQLEEQEGWRLFRNHLKISEGFSFLPIFAPDDWGVALLRREAGRLLESPESMRRAVFDPAAPPRKSRRYPPQPSGNRIRGPNDLGRRRPWNTPSSCWLETKPGATLSPGSTAIATPFSRPFPAPSSSPDQSAFSQSSEKPRLTCGRSVPPSFASKRPAPPEPPWSYCQWTSESGLNRARIGIRETRTKPSPKRNASAGSRGRELLLAELLRRAGRQAVGKLKWDLSLKSLQEAYTLQEHHGGDPEFRFQIANDLSQVLKDLGKYDPRSPLRAPRA